MQTGSNGEFSLHSYHHELRGEETERKADERCDADMKENFVIDPLISKRQQLLLATQLCRMVLKVNNVIIAGSGEEDY